MIKKSILMFIILLALYEAGLKISHIDWDTSQNDKSANLISAQNFIYNTSAKEVKKDTLIVGSSVTRKLVTPVLGENYRNLGFNAWGSFDGLDLVNRTNFKPACILVEMNFVGAQDAKAGIQSSLEPLSYYPNRMFQSFQLRNQPVGLMVGSIKNLMKDKIEAAKKAKRENKELYNFTLDMTKKDLMKPLDDSVLQARFLGLKNLIEKFKAENIGIVFFEVPVDPVLENTSTLLNNRKYFHQFFPDSAYHYISLPPENKYVYSDGVHLNAESAVAFTQYLKNEVNKLNR
jgi:hypothetical protein